MDTSVTCPEKWYPALENFTWKKKRVNLSKSQANSSRIICNVVTASLSEECFCLLSKQIYLGHKQKKVGDT